MALQPVAGRHELWRAEGAQPGEPGLHALVVGISEYPYLGAGALSHGVPDTYGMGQLVVSAKTAARLFAWLQCRDEAARQPIKSCRLLLAPQPGAETEFVDAAVKGPYGAPDFEQLRAAIDGWTDEFLLTPPSRAQRNASLLFFSGHGIEHFSSPSLLARDFLKPVGDKGKHLAVATKRLIDALMTYNIAASFYFIDACRNNPPALMAANPVGEPIVKPSTTFTVAPDTVVWLQATSQLQFAYQPATPDADGTFFGQALIEGLEGRPPDFAPYQLDADPCPLVFGELESFVKNRTRELLEEVNPALTQAVRAGGDPYEAKALIAETPRLSFSARGLVVAAPAARPSGFLGAVGSALKGVVGHVIDAKIPSVVSEILALTDVKIVRSLRAGAPPPSIRQLIARSKPVWRLDPGIMTSRVAALQHRVAPSLRIDRDLSAYCRDAVAMQRALRHQRLTQAWLDSFQMTRLGDRRETASHVVSVSAARTTETAGTLAVWLDLVSHLTLANDAVWIALGGGATGWPKLAVVLPADRGPLPVRLEATFSADGGQFPVLASLSARVGPPDLLADAVDDELARIWTGLWEAQSRETFLNLATAADAVSQLDGAERALFRKSRSPVAAAIGAAILLRAGALDRLRDWPRNLAARFDSADGAVLWAETLFARGGRARTRDAPPHGEAMEYFARMATLGLPRLSAVLEMALRRADRLNDLPRERIAPRGDALRAVFAQAGRAAMLARPGGVFASFGPLPDRFDASAIYRPNSG